MYQDICFLDNPNINIEESLILRNHLESKLKNKKVKQKFKNLTNKLINYGFESNNNIKMIHYL